jgi:hypothetical protein
MDINLWDTFDEEISTRESQKQKEIQEIMNRLGPEVSLIPLSQSSWKPRENVLRNITNSSQERRFEVNNESNLDVSKQIKDLHTKGI